MNHILAVLFGFILCFGHSQTALTHANDSFVPPDERTADWNADIPLLNHQQVLRRVASNSYSEDACLSSCHLNANSMSNTSQPQLLLRAPR